MSAMLVTFNLMKELYSVHGKHIFGYIFYKTIYEKIKLCVKRFSIM